VQPEVHPAILARGGYGRLVRRRLLSLVAATLVCLSVVTASATPAAAAPVNTTPPSITGTAEYAATLTAQPGTWSPTPTSYAYRWLRDGEAIPKADQPTYVPGLDDLDHRLSVEVTASDGSTSAVAVSAETEPVARALLKAKGGQKVVGEARYTRTLVAKAGSWSSKPTRISYQWLRFGEPIAGATSRRYAIGLEDFDTRLRVEITAKAPGFQPLTVVTDRTDRVGHRVNTHRTIRYHVETRGTLTTSLKTFVRQAQETFDDPRGWRGAGIEFRRVGRGGSMTLVLSAAGLVPSFSSGCSSEWSCRVGRYVIINQERWKHASPAWNAANGALRDYRHMVVNHESGHFLGLGHAGCPGAGRPAPVMMQQSKGLGGCRFNPWPTARELASRTPGPGRAMAYAAAAGYSRPVEHTVVD
jgi:hypothetical protein